MISNGSTFGTFDCFTDLSGLVFFDPSFQSTTGTFLSIRNKRIYGRATFNNACDLAVYTASSIVKSNDTNYLVLNLLINIKFIIMIN